MNQNICVYSSSSDKLDGKYYALAEELGEKMAERGHTLVFGAGVVGTMGATARGIKKGKGRIIGIIPEKLNLKGIVYEECDELIVTPEMRSRKKLLDERSDAFIALPGGFGTFEEVLEVITSKQLGYHSKPIVFLNYEGYYDPLFAMFEKSYAENFAKPVYRTLYHVSESVEDALCYIENYKPVELEDKWS